MGRFINGIVSIAGFAITSLLILGSIFSSGIRSNVTDLYSLTGFHQALLVFTSLSLSLTPYLLQ